MPVMLVRWDKQNNSNQNDMLMNNKKAMNRQTHSNKQSHIEKEKKATRNAAEA